MPLGNTFRRRSIVLTWTMHVAVTNELETPFLLVVHLVESELSGRMGGRRGARKRRQGGVVTRARLSRVCRTRLRGNGGREMSTVL